MGTLHRSILCVAMAGAMLWTSYALYDGIGQGDRIERALGMPLMIWIGLLALAGGLQLWAFVALLRRRCGSATAVGWGITLLLMFWLGYLVFCQPLNLFALETAAAGAAGLFALALLLSHRLAPLAERRWLRLSQLILFNLGLTALLLEVGLSLFAAISPQPILMCRDGYVLDRLTTYAFPENYVHLGFPCNTLGHYDQEFLVKAERKQPAVLMIGDSFSASVVPHHHHFSTVCERQLGDVDVYNMGMAGIGPEEYLYLLSREGLPLQPDAVVINIFLGNDLTNTRTGTGVSQQLAAWFDRGNVRLWFVPERLLLISAERRRGDPKAFRQRPQQLLPTPNEQLAVYPWLDDYRLEPASLSESRYLEIVKPQIRSACPPTPARLQALQQILTTMQSLCRGIPFGVVLIPAEYQLEDQLWRDATAQIPGGPHQRQAAQSQLGRWLDRAGIPHLDLLPALQAAAPQTDGDRHCYLLRDTHFNARGNRLAGIAMAPFLRQLLR